MKKVLMILVILIMIAGCAKTPTEMPVEEASVNPTSTSEPEVTATTMPDEELPLAPPEFIHANGRDLVRGDDETPIYLRGTNFSNYIWDRDHESLLSVNHHQREDYFKVAEMGMNVVRLNLSTYHFESDDAPYTYLETGWVWLDQEIEWAKEAGVTLILNIHFAPGMSADTDIEFWKDEENQKRVVEIWRVIAQRYKDEPVIAAYDIFNEPEPPSVEIWKKFVDAMVEAIREEDQNHLIILESILGIRDEAGNWSSVENPFIEIEDDNYMLDFHFYYPFPFTHQKMEWAGIKEIEVYPTERVNFDWEHVEWADGHSGNALPQGTTDWAYYTSGLGKVPQEAVILGKPNPSCGQLGDGTAHFADFTIKAYDQNGTFVEDVMKGFVNDDQTWRLWSNDGSGDWALSTSIPDDVNVRSLYSIQLHGTNQGATIFNDRFAFVANSDYQYAIEGWMKGEDIAKNTSCQFQIEWYTVTEGEPILHENRDYLEEKMIDFIKVANEANVPINVGEFGVNWYGWLEDRGGAQWYADTFSLMDEYDLHFQTWAYHDIFGIYTEWEVYPAENSEYMINTAMMETLMELFAALDD